MRVALDSNLLIYLARVWKVEADRAKTPRLQHLLRSLSEKAEIVVPYQALGETYRVMQRYGYSRALCREQLLLWADTFETAASSTSAFLAAFDLASEHALQFWDALIVSIAAEAGCRMLLSEDLQDGFAWRGVTVLNPLADRVDTRLAKLLDFPQ